MGVVISNLNSLASEDVISRVCAGFGVVVQTTLLPMQAGQPVSACVTFSSPEQAAQCISALNGSLHDLSGQGKPLIARATEASSGGGDIHLQICISGLRPL